MLKSFKCRLYPSRSQARLLEQTLETCRRWYNTCLEERKTAWEERRESISKYAQLRKVKDLKDTNPYAANIHSHVVQIVVQDLDKAFNAFFRRVQASETPGYPRFKGRNRFNSFGFKEYGNGFKLDGRRLRLSGISRVRVRWHRPIEGTIKTVRIVHKAGKWHACFACAVEPQPLAPTGREVGIDAGVNSLLTTSDGEQVENPKWYRAEQKKLRVLGRRVSRRQLGGSNRRRAVAALQRQHERIANRRKDYWHKLTQGLVERYDRIALEDLQIANMVHNCHLSKSILDAGWGYPVRAARPGGPPGRDGLKVHLAHTLGPPAPKGRGQGQAAEAGRVVYWVNPAHTSKTCSQCDCVFEALTLSDRWVQCECGLSLDRDHNAALNILKRAGHAHWGVTWPVAASVPQEAPAL